jgi:hypothetical protein
LFHADAANIFEESAGNNPLRDPGKISIKFTPRVFPTAARESQAANEEEVCMQKVLLTIIP